MAEASRWLRHYLSALDARSLTREFAVILEATSENAFGEDGRAVIGDQLRRWNTLLRNDSSVTKAQVAAWARELEISRGAITADSFPYLSKVSPQWDEVKDSLERASALGFMESRFRSIRDTATFKVGSIIDRLDDLLEVLVTEFDAEELPYQRDVAYHQAVVDNHGDLNRAREVADAYNAALEETMDLMSLQTQTALRPRAFGVSQGTQRVAVGAAKSDFEQGIGIFTSDYRAKHRHEVEIVLGSNHSNYAMSLGFGEWRTSTSENQSIAETSLTQAWEKAVAQYLERVKFKDSTYGIAGIIVALAAALGFLVSPSTGVVFLMIAAIGAGIWVYTKKKSADEEYHKAVAAKDQAIQFSIDIYRNSMAEFSDAELQYADDDAKEADLLELVRTWPTVVSAEAVGASV